MLKDSEMRDMQPISQGREITGHASLWSLLQLCNWVERGSKHLADLKSVEK